MNPTFQELEEATFDIVVAGRSNDQGGIDILMIEGEAPDNTWPLLAAGEGAAAPTEEVVAEGLEAGEGAIAEVIDFQEEFLAAVGVKPSDFEPAPAVSATICGRRSSRSRRTGSRPRSFPTGKSARPSSPHSRTRRRRTSPRRSARTTSPQRASEFSPAWKSLQKKVMRKRVIEEGVRLDGRGPTRHPPALGRGRAAAPGARLRAVPARRHAGAQRHDARHAADDADDRHARPRGHEAVHAPLQLPAVLDRRDGPRRLAPPPRDRPRSARRAGARSR